MANKIDPQNILLKQFACRESTKKRSDLFPRFLQRALDALLLDRFFFATLVIFSATTVAAFLTLLLDCVCRFVTPFEARLLLFGSKFSSISSSLSNEPSDSSSPFLLVLLDLLPGGRSSDWAPVRFCNSGT